MKLNILSRDVKSRPRTSLLRRYTLVSTVLIIGIIIAIALVYQKLDDRNITQASALLDGQNTFESIREIKTSLQEVQYSLSAYLVVQDEKLMSNVDDNIKKIEKKLYKLAEKHWVKGNDASLILVRQLQISIQQLAPISAQLFAISQDRERLFPAMTTIVNDMFPANTEFEQSVSLALDELKEIPDSRENREVKNLFDEAKLKWVQMISSFRVFIAFRTGTFGAPEIGMPVHSHNVELQHEALLKALANIRRLRDKRDIGFQTVESLDVMIDASFIWYQGYEEVKLIQSSDYWRQDTPIMEKQLRPLFLNIYSGLDQLGHAIEESYLNEIVTNENVSRETNYVLWLLGMFIVAFIMLGYYYLHRGLLGPLKLITNSLVNEVQGNAISKLPKSNTQEMFDLLSAYHHMREMVENREEKLEFQAMHDDLTNLPNRVMCRNLLNQAIQHVAQSGRNVILLIIDLDRFKEINDTLGHPTGDKVLKHLADRLSVSLRDVGTLCRLGGDEFGLLLRAHDTEEALRVAFSIHNVLDKEIILGEHHLRINASMGIAIYPDHAHDVDTLIAHADVAMYQAKDEHSMTVVYDKSFDPYSESRLHNVNRLRSAIDKGELDLHFQPQVSLKTNRIRCFEALLRCSFSELSTYEMIRLAENTGLIHPVTEWVMGAAMEACSQWHAEGNHLSVAINLSGICFQNTEIEKRLTNRVSNWDIASENLKLEITETTMMSDPEGAANILTRIGDTGVKVAVDDFGTGFSSLSYLKNLPVNELKIDQSFVKNMHDNPQDLAIVRSIIDLAHNLGLKVVAEGVETLAVWELLIELDCDYAQGYFISRPLPGGDVINWINNSRWKSKPTKVSRIGRKQRPENSRFKIIK